MPAARDPLGSTDPGPASLRPEARLLLAIAGGESCDSRIAELAKQQLDWSAFLEITVQERAEAIVAARLKRVGVTLPADVAPRLRSIAMRSDLRMATLSHRLDQTLNALVAAGIPVMLLKGSALGKTLYRTLPRRPMLDLDLLIPEAESARAREVVLATGWVTGPLEGALEFYRDHYHLPPFLDRAGGDFSLELHHGLFFRGHPFGLEVSELWDKSRPLAGYPGVQVPSTTHMILHLAVHFAWSHAMHSGAWRTLRDLRVLAESGEIDWDEIVRQARRIRGASCCFWAFHFARRWAQASIPEKIITQLRPPTPGVFLPVLERHFEGQWYPGGAECPSARLEWILWRAAIRPGRSGHGPVLPWQRNELFPQPVPDPSSPAEESPKISRHLAKVGMYVDYLRRVLAL